MSTTPVLTTMEELHEYFDKWVGPVFCVPGRNLLKRRPDMMNMVGIIIPPLRRDTKLLCVDWSLDKKHNEIKNKYNGLSQDDLYIIEDLCIIKPGADIPALAFANYYGWIFSDFKQGDVVCISHHRLLKAKGTEQAYITVRNKIGVVNDRCDDPTDGSLMVAFTKNGESRVVNVEKQVLVKLPPSFGPPQSQLSTPLNHLNQMSSIKYKTGQIVKISSSVQDETFMGLIGIVKEVHPKPTNLIGFTHQFSNEYTIDLNVLPTRNISLIKGEKGTICVQKKFREFDLDEWDEKVSDKAHLAMFRARWDRDMVWCIENQCYGRVDMIANPKKSLADGIQIKVHALDDNGATTGITRKMSCRDVDYVWDESVLLELAKLSAMTLGVEEDKRNPNEVCSKVYLYLYESKAQIGKILKFRILLGTLVKRKSIVKKFAKALILKDLTHPWQVRRYLRADSLGYFYKVFNANEWLTSVGKFSYTNA